MYCVFLFVAIIGSYIECEYRSWIKQEVWGLLLLLLLSFVQRSELASFTQSLSVNKNYGYGGMDIYNMGEVLSTGLQPCLGTLRV